MTPVRKPYVVGFIVCLSTSEVLLIKKTRPVWQAGYLNGIGGKVEIDENGNYERAAVAMSREANEECGINIPAERWINFADMQSNNWIVWCFIANVSLEEFARARTMETEEITTMNLVDIHLKHHHLLGNIAWLVNMGLDAFFNKGAFEPPSITYNGFSFPLIMAEVEKKRRMDIEHKAEIAWKH
jgi:8-oxo-dGTP pyrophosphatase MutT (NUDIX family)